MDVALGDPGGSGGAVGPRPQGAPHSVRGSNQSGSGAKLFESNGADRREPGADVGGGSPVAGGGGGRVRLTSRLPDTFFDRMYEDSADPWSLAARWYEQRKYAITLSL